MAINARAKLKTSPVFYQNKLAFGQTRFAAAADPIEHISEEKFLLQIFANMETL